MTIGGAETRTLSVALMVERENDLLGDDKSEIGIKSQGRGILKLLNVVREKRAHRVSSEEVKLSEMMW